jgi:hypothetical protein
MKERWYQLHYNILLIQNHRNHQSARSIMIHCSNIPFVCFSGISRDSCEIVNWNYTILAELSYEEALNYTSNANYPGKYECDSWSYEGNGIVSEVRC